MKKTTLLITFFLIAMGVKIQAQCIGTYEYVTVASNNDGNVQTMDGCNYSGDWNNITGLLVGSDYEFSSDIPTDYLTFTDDSNNVIASGVTPLVVSGITVTSGRIHVYYDASCTGDSTCRATTIQCTTCTPPPAPDCASNPYPEDGAIDVPNGDITFTWVAPTTGPTPTSYNMYAGETPSGDDYGLIGNFTTTDALITITGYDILLYWKIVPVNGTTEAVGCPVWSFTTESAPPPPTNDDIADAIVLTVDAAFCDGTNTNGTNVLATDSLEANGSCFNGTNPTDDVWFSFTVPANVATVDVSTDFTGGTLTDSEITLYSGTSGSLTELACDQDSGTTTLSNGFDWNSLITDAAVTVGETYYVQVAGYGSGTNQGTFCVEVSTNQALSTQNFEASTAFSYYPNPVNNTLSLRGVKDIQNVAVYNMLGQEVLRTAPNTVNSDVDMSGLQSGTYFVKVMIENATKTIKIIKK